jgi:hypothetical protein
MHKRLISDLVAFSVFFLLLPFSIEAQIFPDKNYPKGYFRNPLGIPMNLSGNFGELRPNHYHMGLDLKTEKRENLPVYAAAEGYIARIKIEPAGFGRAIYINHPNGFTTLYAHLNNFTPALDHFVKQQQYKLESWKVFLELPAGLFPVKKGDFIAYSGNTGGSQAPHLHFEIRRTVDDVNLNPMLFGFPLADNTRPSILRLAIYDRNKSTYEQSPRIIPVVRTASGYVTSPATILSTSNRISLGITAYDTHTGSTNQNGIFEAVITDNGRPLSAFRMDEISYNDTRYMNAHIDYRTKANGGPYLQHLSALPGYLNSIYADVGDGVLDLSDGEVHAITITIRDPYGNTSELRSNIKHNGAVASPGVSSAKMFYPLMLDVFESEDCEFYMGENCLYDSVRIKYAAAKSSNPAVVSDVHAIGAAYIPLQDSFMVRLRPNREIDESRKSKVVMQRFSGTKKSLAKVEWQGNWASAKFRDFGNFQLVSDESPPVIVPIGFVDGSNLSRASGISITVRDNLEAFKNFRAELDGKWLRFTNDKGKTFHYRFDERCPPGQHELKIYVEDEAGNATTKVYRFTR